MATITVTRVKQLEIVVNGFPVYRKDICHAYKVINDKQAICICHGIANCERISICRAESAWDDSDTNDCTEDQFNILYNGVESKIQTLKELSEVEVNEG